MPCFHTIDSIIKKSTLVFFAEQDDLVNFHFWFVCLKENNRRGGEAQLYSSLRLPVSAVKIKKDEQSYTVEESDPAFGRGRLQRWCHEKQMPVTKNKITLNKLVT